VAEVVSVSSDEQRGRIERITFWSWILLAAFVVVSWLWFIYRTGVCPGDVGRVALAVCRYSFVLPTVLGIALLLALPLTIVVLVGLGRERDAAAPGEATAGLSGHAHRMTQGYRALEIEHRKRVRRVLLLVSAVAGAFAGQLIFTYLDAPALAGLLLGIAPVLVVLAVNHWAINDTPPQEAALAAALEPLQDVELERRLLTQRRMELMLRDNEIEGHWALALSGGGIRSATFSLGVLQAIARTGSEPERDAKPKQDGNAFRASMLSRFDYLSTVSGGGYAGAFLCSLFVPERLQKKSNRETAADDAVAALAIEAPGRIRSSDTYKGGDKLRAPLAWLRENGRYLVPTGIGDAVYAAALGLRNWISLHVVIGAVLMALFAFIALVRHHLVALDASLANGLTCAPQPALEWLRQWEFARLCNALGGIEPFWFSSLFPAALLPLLLWAVPAGVAFWMTYQLRPGHSAGWLGPFNRAVVGMLLAVLVFGLLLLIDRATIGGDFDLEAVWSLQASPWTPRQTLIAALAAEVVLGLLWYLPYALRYPVVTEQRNRLTRALSTALVATTALVALGLIETLGQTLYLWATLEESVMPIAGSAGLMGALVWLVKKGAAALTRADQPSFLARIPLTTLAGIAGFVIFIVIAALWVTAVDAMLWFGAPPDAASFFGGSKLWFLSALVSSALLLALLTGQYPSFINLSGLQSFYGARLTRAYLGATNGDRFQDDRPDLLSVAEPLPGDKLELDRFYALDKNHQIDRLTTAAPLHIINVTVNKTVDPAEQLVQRDRKGQPLAVLPFGFAIDCESLWRYKGNLFGSEIARTLNLGQWIGTSGAAFSTGIGRETSLGMSLLMGMANVRLGLWWQSGRDERKWSAALRSPGSLIGAIFRTQAYLSYELRARFYGLSRAWQYLSDGGHFENTAIYELLRPHRRVSLIVASDNGADPQYGFGDLANLMRLARIDLGVEIEVENVADNEPKLRGVFGMPKDFARDPKDRTKEWKPPLALLLKATRSTTPFTTWIVLLKPALFADAPADVLQYAGTHAAFPQEPTTDQFFNEAQWESYRALGQRCAERVFDATVWNAVKDYIKGQAPARP